MSTPRSRVWLAPAAILMLGGLPWLGVGCVNVRTAPIRVEPVHITVDVNLRVARELDGFFGDLDRREQALITGAESPPNPGTEARP